MKIRNLYSAQFRALFIKDMLSAIQGRLIFVALRILIPTIVILITYIVQYSKKVTSFSGIPKAYHVSELKIPRCYVCADVDDRVGLGAKLLKEPCVTLAYYPVKDLTNDIISKLLVNLQLEETDAMGFDSIDAFEQYSEKTKALFFINFGDDIDNTNTYEENIKKLLIALKYNQTYADSPGFWRVYGDEQLSDELGLDLGIMMISPHTGVPAALQLHIQRALLQVFDIDFDPSVKSLPYISTNNIPNVPNNMITGALFVVTIALHFVFSAIHISQDKGSGALDAMRLSGMSDFIFWGEQFVFQMMIFVIQLLIQLLAMFAMPGGNDMYPFVDIGFSIFLLVIGGLYATSLALLLNSFSSPKVTIQLVILFFVLCLGGLIIFFMFGSEFLYDPSIIPISFGRWLVRWIYPFSQLLGAATYLFTKSAPVVIMDYDSLDYHLERNQTAYENVSFLSARKDSACMLENNCVFNAPSVAASVMVPLVQTVLFWLIAWLFGEWLPTYASASRPPWKIFTKNFFDISDCGFTMAAVKKRQEHVIQTSLSTQNQLRKPIDKSLALKLLQEINCKCSPESFEQSLKSLTSMNDSDIILQTHHLHKTFRRPASQRTLLGKEHFAVKSVNLQIHKGEIYGLAGHNGAGKSTTLNMIIGQLRPDSPGPNFFKANKIEKPFINNGWIENQYDIRNQMHKIRRTLGVCPQFNTNVFQQLTVYQNLRFICQLQNIPEYEHDKLIQSILKAVGLVEWSHKKLKTLSGGMQRRISICMALVNPQTRLIILDEPTTGLDPQTKRVIWSVIKKAARIPRKSPIVGGTTNKKIQHFRIQEPLPALILTSHDMMELDTISDNVGIMASGHLVTQGTPLHMKTRYGGGYTLTVIAFDRNSQEQFFLKMELFVKQQFHFIISKLPQDEDQNIRIIDRSGAVVAYAVHQRCECELQQIVSFVESFVIDKRLLQDFTLERSSMDKVFITVGNMYDMENGGSQFTTNQKQQIQPIIKSVINTSEQENAEKILVSDLNIEYSDQENQKMSNIDDLSQDQITKILSPPHYKQQNFRAMMNKMVYNDQLKSIGIISFILLPVIFVIITFLIGDVLFPWVFDKMASLLGGVFDQKNQLCDMCSILKSYELLIPQCEDFDAWGNPNMCKQNVVFQSGQEFDLPPTYYGGDLSIFQDFSLYSTLSHPMKIAIFDQFNEYGRAQTIDNIIVKNFQGDKVQYSSPLTSTKNEFKVINASGYYQTDTLKQKVIKASLQISASNQQQTFFDLLSSQTIAQQQISLDNKKFNKFQIMRDVEYIDGIDQYMDMQTLNNQFMRYLQRGQIPLINLTGLSNITEEEKQWWVETQDKRGDTSVRSRSFYYLRMNEYYNLQQLQSDLVQHLPMAVDFNPQYYSRNLNESNSSIKFGPLIQALLPAKTEMPFYDGYRHSVRLINDSNFNSFVSYINTLGNNQQDIVDNFFTHHFNVRFAADSPPSIFSNGMFSVINVIPTTPLLDITTRLTEGLLRQHISNDTNLQMSIQPYKHKYLSLMDLGTMGSSLQIGSLFITIGSLFGITKYGYHLVLDRSSGMRRQLYLNGVNSITYWIANLVYSFSFALLTMILVVLFGAGIFRLSIFLRMDTVMIILLIIGGTFTSVSISFLIASLLSHTAMYSAASVIVLIASIIIVLFNVDQVASSPKAIAYILPSMCFVSLLQYLSFNGFDASVVFSNEYGFLYVWMIVESIIFILLAIYFDQVLPMNGYKPQPWYWPFICCRRRKQTKQQGNTYDDVTIPQNGVALGDELDPQQNKLKQYPTSINLNSFPNNQISVKSVRDQAAQHSMEKMDIDVYAERCKIATGIPRSPVVVCNIQKIFGNFMALRDMTFHLPYNQKGTVFALLGPNGAAKTTTINLMVGLTSLTQGKVFLFGKDMETQAQEVYPYLGLCSQFDVFLPNLTVREHLRVFAAVHGVRWTDIDEVVENLAIFVQLGEVLDKQVGQLSGGMKRRMSLALALIG